MYIRKVHDFKMIMNTFRGVLIYCSIGSLSTKKTFQVPLQPFWLPWPSGHAHIIWDPYTGKISTISFLVRDESCVVHVHCTMYIVHVCDTNNTKVVLNPNNAMTEALSFEVKYCNNTCNLNDNASL